MLANNKMYLCSNEETVFDSNYRYRVDPPNYEILSKKGKDITCFTNSVSFARSIQFDHELMVRILGSEMSCKSSVDKDLKCAVFQGIHEKTKINNIICNLIKDYLLCQLCDRPEVTLYANKHKLRQKCRACGEKNFVKPELEYTDMYDIILKNLQKKILKVTEKN